MGVLKKNIAANYVGQTAAALTAFIVVPLYIKYLGTESYGLVAFFLSLQAVMMLFDMGMSTSASREIGRVLELNPEPNAKRHMLRTLEGFYFALCVIAFAIAAVAGRWLATNWVQTGSLDRQTVIQCAYLAAGCMALRFPVALYQGFFRGIEKQVDLNVLFTNLVIIKGVGSVLTLAFVAPTVFAFYWWQLIFGIGEVLLLGIFSWRNVGGLFTGPASFQWPLLKTVWKFAFKVGGVSMLAVVMKQMDKFAVSRLLPLEFVGFYSTAAMGANATIKLYQPVQAAVFPRFNRMIARGEEMSGSLHANSQFVAFMASPFAAALMVFPFEVLLAWTHSPALAESAAPAFVFLALWTLTSAMLSIPNMVQFATGMTWLPLYANAISAALIIPALFLATWKFGILGAALCWGVQGALAYILVPAIMFRYTLKGEAMRWYFYDTLPFMIAALACFLGMRWLFPVHTTVQLFAVGAAGFWCYGVACLTCSKTLRTRLESLPVGGKALIWARRWIENRAQRAF